MRQLQLLGLPGFPLVEPGDDLALLIQQALTGAGLSLIEGDVLALAQKIVSKAENRYAYLNEVTPSPRALELAQKADKDPRVVELMLRESTAVLRHRPGAIVVEHRRGYVHANAGIDQSNISSNPDNPRVLLLPADSDASAAALRESLRKLTGVAPHIIINDSAGRAWRHGTVGMAIGTAGFAVIRNQIGERDLFGRVLQVTEVAVADELAAAASFVMGQSTEATPVVLIRGAQLQASSASSAALIRPREQDMFR